MTTHVQHPGHLNGLVEPSASAPMRAAQGRMVDAGPAPAELSAGPALPRHAIRVDDRVVNLFFLMGCFKSGTNWVQNILNLHPLVDLRGEFHFEVVLKAIEHSRSVHWFRGSAAKFREAWNDAGESVVRSIMRIAAHDKPGVRWLGDRSPGALRTVIRGAPHIVITRDFRDVLVSWSFHHLRVTNEEGIGVPFRDLWRRASEAFRADPEGFNPMDGLLGHEPYVRKHARTWAEIVRTTRRNAPLMRDEGTPVLELRYESLHEDLAGNRRRLFEHLGLDPGDAAEPSPETKTTPGFEKEDRASFYRRGKVGDWKRYLDDRIVRTIKEVAGEELIAEGYEKDLNW